MIVKASSVLFVDSATRSGLAEADLFSPVQLSIPSVPALPRAKNIPFRLSLLLLAPKLYHVDPSSPEPPTISPPTPDSLAIFLIRNVFTQAQGKSQVLHQVVGPVTDLSTESRVWYGKQERKGAEFEDRYGCEVVCVGEMEVGWGSTQAAGPSFGVENTRGLLSCGVSEPPLFPSSQ